MTKVLIWITFTDPEVIRLYQSCHMFASPACTPQCCDRYAVHWIKFQTKCYLLIATKHGVEVNSVEFSIESETTICIVVSDRIKEKQLLFPYHLYCQERKIIFSANLIDTMAISCLLHGALDTCVTRPSTDVLLTMQKIRFSHFFMVNCNNLHRFIAADMI